MTTENTTILVKRFNKEELVEVDSEANAKAKWFSKIIYDVCPVCGTNAEMDIMYHGAGLDGVCYACGHEAHYRKGEEPKYC